VWIATKRSFGRAQAREPRFRFGFKPSPAVPAAEMERAASRRKSEGDVTTTVNLRQAGKFPASMRHNSPDP